ncbi:hypothetical protein [Mesorhizobium sp. 10J20-29]
MHKYSQKATSFVVMAHYAGEPSVVRSFTLSAETPLREVFTSLWPTGVSETFAGTQFARTPLRIEILPDEKSIPVIDEPDPFSTAEPTAA